MIEAEEHTTDVIYMRRDSDEARRYSLAALIPYVDSIWEPYSYDDIEEVMGDTRTQKVLVPDATPYTAVRAVRGKVGAVEMVKSLTVRSKASTIRNGFPVLIRLNCELLSSWDGEFPDLQEGEAALYALDVAYIQNRAKSEGLRCVWVSDNDCLFSNGYRAYRLNAETTRITYEPEKARKELREYKERCRRADTNTRVRTFASKLRDFKAVLNGRTLTYIRQLTANKYNREKPEFIPVTYESKLSVSCVDSEEFRAAARYTVGSSDIKAIVRYAFRKHPEHPRYVDYPGMDDYEERIRYFSHLYLNNLEENYTTLVQYARNLAEATGAGEEKVSRTGRAIVGANTLFKDTPELHKAYRDIMDTEQIPVYRYLYNKIRGINKSREVSDEIKACWSGILTATFFLDYPEEGDADGSL